MLFSSFNPPFSRAIRILCGIAAVFSTLIPQSHANSVGSIDVDNRPRLSNSAKAISSIAASLPDKIVGNNRFIVGFTFSGFSLRKIYPYFSVDIKNARNPSFHPRENHHVYSGILLLGLGEMTHKRYLRTIGTVLMVDDLIEHVFNIKSALSFAADRIDHRDYSKITAAANGLFR